MAIGAEKPTSKPSANLGTGDPRERPMNMNGPIEEAEKQAAECDDAALIEQCRLGNTAAYGDLVAKYQDRVFNVCWRMCGNRADAEDLTQETFVKALSSIQRFAGRSGFYTWIFRIAVNLAISARRKGKRRMTLSLDAAAADPSGDRASSLAERIASREDPPDRHESDRERHEIVTAALASLDQEQRSIVILRDLEGFGYDEIAEMIDVPIGTVKSRLHRARLALRDKLMPILGTS